MLLNIYGQELSIAYLDAFYDLRHNTLDIHPISLFIRSGNAKIYEIAEMVGIRDPNYFSSLFKKIVGIAPKEYKSLVGSQERTKKI